jgi:hypothetical protein
LTVVGAAPAAAPFDAIDAADVPAKGGGDKPRPYDGPGGCVHV